MEGGKRDGEKYKKRERKEKGKSYVACLLVRINKEMEEVIYRHLSYYHTSLNSYVNPLAFLIHKIQVRSSQN